MITSITRLIPKLKPCYQIRNVRPTVKINKENFKLCIDVHQFTKDELRVKAREEYVIIEGKQERKTDSGCYMRNFVRRFKLPEGCDPKNMKSQLSDGHLTITVPRNTCTPDLPCEILIPIKSAHDENDDEKLNKK